MHTFARLRTSLARALFATVCTVLFTAGWLATSPRATGQAPATEEALPEERVVIDIDAPEQQVFRIGILDLRNPDRLDGVADEKLLRNDFRLMPGYRVLDPRSLPKKLATEELGSIRAKAWSDLQANGVLKGRMERKGKDVRYELEFFRVSEPDKPALARTYTGPVDATKTRRHLHDFANRVLELLTGELGPFGTELAFAQKLAPGRKEVYCTGMDGHGLYRISRLDGLSLLPGFGDGVIWFTRMTTRGMHITHNKAQEKKIITGDGLNMAPTVCDGRVYFTSSRDGNSEIYSAKEDGSDVRRLTNDAGIDVSPSCGPKGKLAWVSTRHGSPQIFTMNTDGSNVKRVTFKGSHNQTPSYCRNPQKPLIAFTGRDEGTDIFVVNVNTQEYTRVTQGQGVNKDPAFSRDCRLLAFVSDRRGAPGIYLSSVQGYNQNRIREGAFETVRWAP